MRSPRRRKKYSRCPWSRSWRVKVFDVESVLGRLVDKSPVTLVVTPQRSWLGFPIHPTGTVQ